MKKITLFAKHNPLYSILILSACLFGILLLRNPFSVRTLIPNFEPYPDTIHYMNPVRSFLAGKGWMIEREGRIFPPGVPPLYSIILLPFFVLYNDARIAYVANVFLAFISLYLFFILVKKLTNNIFVAGLVLSLYVTNYYFYWYPTIVMAENLLLPLFLLSIFILIEKTTLRNAFLAGFLSICFYAVKYANVPLSFSLIILYGIKLLSYPASKKEKKNNILFFILGAVISVMLFAIWRASIYGLSSLLSYIHVVDPFLKIFEGPPKGVSQGVVVNSSPWFSLKYIGEFFPRYMKSLVGEPTRFLWESTPIVGKGIGFIGIAGLILSVFLKKFRFLGISLLTFLLSSMLFMSTFYSFDMRYVYHAIPTILLGAVLFFVGVEQYAKRRNLRFIIPGVIMLIFLIYCGQNAVRMKKQIMLNLKYSETPWYYLSVMKLNKYFSQKKKGKKKPVVISALMPYYIDFFSNGNYTLLPLSQQQDFRTHMIFAWGEHDYSNLPMLYEQYLKQGYVLYIHKSLGNEAYLHEGYKKVFDLFKTELVQEGCLGSCNIYKISIKE